MTDKTFQIRIESIMGGESAYTHLSRDDQYLRGASLNPESFPNVETSNDFTSVFRSTGTLGPNLVTYSTVNNNPTNPQFIKSNVKNGAFVYVYDAKGSIYYIDLLLGGSIGVGDLNDGGTAKGNGMEYYDNYMYFARDTTIARYGPMDGSPAFTDDYWVSTLSKAALTDTAYPSGNPSSTYKLPNHVMHRHSDGKLYIADVVGNQGTIHYISTTKTTVEGDTDNGSKANALTFGYGLWPTAIESYGSSIAIAFVEQYGYKRAKLAFWDTTAQNFNQITWVEFPDNIITSMKNINGVLYIASTNSNGTAVATFGMRITRYVGGYTFEDVLILETAYAPGPGGMDGNANRLCFGTNAYGGGAVYSIGLQKSINEKAAHLIMGGTDLSGDPITAIAFIHSLQTSYLGTQNFPVGISSAGKTVISYGTKNDGSANSLTSYALFWSKLFKVGRPFKIQKIRLHMLGGVGTSTSISPKLYFDEGNTNMSLKTINATNYAGLQNVVLRPENATGQHNFFLALEWNQSIPTAIGLPITIEGEFIDD